MGALVIDADDFGADALRNLGIFVAAGARSISSISVLVTPRSHPGTLIVSGIRHLFPSIRIALHVDLTSKDLLSGSGVDLFSGEPPDYTDKRAFWQKATAGQLNIPRVSLEVELQIQRFISLYGFAPMGLDSHNHVHISSPAVFRVFESFRQTYNLPQLRWPCELLTEARIAKYIQVLIDHRVVVRDQPRQAPHHDTISILPQLIHRMRDIPEADILLYEFAGRQFEGMSSENFVGTTYGFSLCFRELFRLFSLVRVSEKRYRFLCHPGLNIVTSSRNTFSCRDRLRELFNLIMVVLMQRLMNFVCKDKLRIL